MEIRNLKFFKHLSESLHFGRTSRACNITPSALTRVIQRMEEELGTVLFIRDNRTVELSPAGFVFKKYVEETIGRWDELQDNLSHESKLSGEISLYCSVTAAYTILPTILGRFRSAYPDLQINLQTGDAAQAITKIENNEIDITIAALRETMPERLQVMEMLTTPLVFIAPKNYPELVVKGENNEIDWRKTPLILAKQGLSRERTESWFQQKKRMPNIYAQVAGNEALIAMVVLGYGVGVVPRLVVEQSPMQAQVTILEVNPELQDFAIGICTLKKKMASPKIMAFWEIAELERAS